MKYKILESLIRDILITYLEESGMLSQDQHGFIKGRDCMTHLVGTLEKWPRWVDEGKCVNNIMLTSLRHESQTSDSPESFRHMEYVGVCFHGWSPF